VAYRDDQAAARSRVAHLERQLERETVERRALERERRELRRALARRSAPVSCLAHAVPRAQAPLAPASLMIRERALGGASAAELHARAARAAHTLEGAAPALARLRDDVERLRARVAAGDYRGRAWQWPVWSCLLAGMLIAAPIYLLGYTVFVWLLGRMF